MTNMNQIKCTLGECTFRNSDARFFVLTTGLFIQILNEIVTRTDAHCTTLNVRI